EPSVAGGVVRGDRLRAPGLQASDVLRTQPGVAVLETGGYGAPSTASIRGATGAQTPVYLAGVRLNDGVGGTADLSLVPLWLLRNVEIYRSNAPLAGDQLGIGGAIFFEPRRAKGTEGSAGAMWGSFGAHALWARAGVGDDDAAAMVGVRIDGATNDYGFVNDNGTRFVPSNDHRVVRVNADTHAADVWTMGSVRLGREGRADWIANGIEREQGLPGLLIFQSTRARVRLRRWLTGVTTRVPCGHAPVDECDVTTTLSAIATRGGYDDPLREAALGTTRLNLEGTRVDDAMVVHWSLSDRISLTPAIRASMERLTIDAANAGPLHAERLFSRAAMQGQWSITDFAMVRALGAAECDGTSRSGVPTWSLPGDATGAAAGSSPCDSFQPAGRLGAEIRHGPVTFLANVGRYARVPTLAELYGISGAVRGNAALVPESGVSVEGGVRWASSSGAFRGISVDVFGFIRTSNDLIAYERASNGYVTPFNVGSTRVAGLELLADYVPAAFALFELSATLLDPRNTSPVRPANDILRYQSRLTLVPHADVHARLHLPPVDSGKLSVSYFYESSRYADEAGLVVIPEQGSLDVEGLIGAFDDRLVLRGRFANLLDQTRFDLIGYPLPGRAAYLALEAQWR
ncbi:MAG: TonB-dependent receptor, partial [Myxococcota bacterium]|nr:TonB-dependent receptor [Myxococcota bacterium]